MRRSACLYGLQISRNQGAFFVYSMHTSLLINIGAALIFHFAGAPLNRSREATPHKSAPISKRIYFILSVCSIVSPFHHFNFRPESKPLYSLFLYRRRLDNSHRVRYTQLRRYSYYFFLPCSPCTYYISSNHTIYWRCYIFLPCQFPTTLFQ